MIPFHFGRVRTKNPPCPPLPSPPQPPDCMATFWERSVSSNRQRSLDLQMSELEISSRFLFPAKSGRKLQAGTEVPFLMAEASRFARHDSTLLVSFSPPSSASPNPSFCNQTFIVTRNEARTSRVLLLRTPGSESGAVHRFPIEEEISGMFWCQISLT